MSFGRESLIIGCSKIGWICVLEGNAVLMRRMKANRTAEKAVDGSGSRAARRAPRWKRMVLAALCLMLALMMIIPAAADENREKTVRVGWFESPFNYRDSFGRCSGYAYEYQQKIAAYTGWRYEYVEGSWPELMEMLSNGELDLLSDVSYTEDRADHVLYSSMPMGTEAYYAYISTRNTEITPENASSLNGKRVGVNRNTVPAALFREWEEQNGVQAEVVELALTEAEWMKMLDGGEIDAYIAVDANMNLDVCMPVFWVGQSDFYFSVTKARPDLLAELNSAMNKIQNENRYYAQHLYDQFIRADGANAFLTSEELKWLDGHETIRVGYRTDYLPYSDLDIATGEFTGALKEYFTAAAACLQNAEIQFTPVAYSTTDAAVKALQNGEIDCVFPINLSAYDAEKLDLLTTSPLMKTEMYAVVMESDRQGGALQQKMTAAVAEGDTNTGVFIKDHYPDWKAHYFADNEDCFRAVRSGDADCFLISNYRLIRTESLRRQYGLTVVTTGKAMNLSFAVSRSDVSLCHILNKTIAMIPEASIDAALTNYSYPDEKTTVRSFVQDNSGSLIFVITTAFIVIVLLLLQSLKNARRANAGEQLISVMEIDPLTQLYNKGFFFEYAARMYEEDQDQEMDAIVLDVEQFHTLNALNGRDFGDFILRLLGTEIKDFLGEREGIASRVDGDRFNIYCEHMEEYQHLFDRLQNKVNELSRNANIRLFMGVMPWQSGVGPSQQFDRAWSACNMARRINQTRLMVYDQKMHDKELMEQRLIKDLRRAVEDHEFEVYYQPKYDLQGSTPTLCSAEALVRWNHPELGQIPPDQFIPLLEKSGEVNHMDHYVWSEVAKQIARWRNQYGITVPVSVNLSRLDVFDPALESTLEELVEKNELDRKALKLEVTESAYNNNAETLVALVDRLRKKGYEVEMDDFGTSYSSLNMLSAMPVDVLKMDRTYIQNMKDDNTIHLVQLILEIAKTLKVPVVAEGVETESQMQLLKELGFALAQGYYFSQPMPPEAFGKEILAQMPAS